MLHTPAGYTSQIYLKKSFFHTTFTVAIPLNDSSFKGNVLELGLLEDNIFGRGGKVFAVVATTVALGLFIAVTRGSLVKFFASVSSNLLSVFSTLPHTNSLRLLLIAVSFSCTIFSVMVCCLRSEWCVATSFYQRAANHVFHFCETYSTLFLQIQCIVSTSGRFASDLDAAHRHTHIVDMRFLSCTASVVLPSHHR